MNRREIFYSMTTNAAHGNSLEIRFQTIPPAAVRAALRTFGFQWHKAKKCWYSYTCSPETARAVIDHATNGAAVTIET